MATLQIQARALGDPTRHEIFRYVRDADRAVGVAELTDHLKFNHNAIRQHLAKLVDARLLVESAARRPGVVVHRSNTRPTRQVTPVGARPAPMSGCRCC
jgi:DNA-binding transcriptional ArsR family regulator